MEKAFEIVFDGEMLPRPMCYVDLCAVNDFIPDFPEDTADWLWTFTICLEREKAAHSSTIDKHVTTTLEKIEQNRRALTNNLISTGRQKEQVKIDIDAWLSGLKTILAHTKTKDTCSWIGKKGI
jgi:hypothetical protein